MVADQAADGLERILVPTDFSAGSERAWAEARRLAARLGAELVLVHVLVETPLYSEGPFTMKQTRGVFDAARAWAVKTLGEWTAAAAAAGISARWVLRTGVPYKEIVGAAARESADLIVIGTHGRGGLDRALLGSVADRVIRLAPCPVVTVRDTE
jgi:nucleotide-binding universal stress UspA family protein